MTMAERLAPADSGTSVFQAFQNAVRTHGERPMLYLVEDTARRYGDSPGAIGYAEADAQVRPLIAAYRSLGLAPGSRVALGLDNRPEFFYHWLALNALRVSVAPLNPHWRSAELEYVLEHSDARLAVTLPDRLQQVRQAAPADCRTLASDDPWTAQGDDDAPAPDAHIGDECALLYTSGTTGRPKGCLLDNGVFPEFRRLVPGPRRLLHP